MLRSTERCERARHRRQLRSFLRAHRPGELEQLYFFRSRIAPRAVEGSTTCPPWVISSAPCATSRRAAARAGSIRSRHPSGATSRAASDGQMVAPRARADSSSRIARSSRSPSAPGRCWRQPALQKRMLSQSRAHFLRHSMRRPQAAQHFSSPGRGGVTWERCRGRAPVAPGTSGSRVLERSVHDFARSGRTAVVARDIHSAVPEGHTIHRLALDHAKDLAGRRVRVSSPQGRFEEPELIDGDRFVSADAWGKHLFHRWESGHVVHVHLGLFGRFFRFVRARPVPRETVRMRLSRLEPEGDQLTLDLVGPTACGLLSRKELHALTARLGPDPLRADADPEKAWEKLRRRRGPIGPLLMDQAVLSGVGNVYRAEALFVHRIHPERPAPGVTRAEFDALWTWLVQALRKGVREKRIITVAEQAAHGGKTRSRRVPREERLYIYKASRCPECEGPVRRWELAGRFAYACERCQK